MELLFNEANNRLRNLESISEISNCAVIKEIGAMTFSLLEQSVFTRHFLL